MRTATDLSPRARPSRPGIPGPSCGSAGLSVHRKETNFIVKPRKKVKSQSPTQKKTEVIFFEDVCSSNSAMLRRWVCHLQTDF